MSEEYNATYVKCPYCGHEDKDSERLDWYLANIPQLAHWTRNRVPLPKSREEIDREIQHHCGQDAKREK